MYLILDDQKIKVVKADKFLLRLKGLMFQPNIDYGILFPKCNSVHTFFMKSSIDIIILNNTNQIIAIYPNIQPNKIITFKSKVKKTSILELPPHTSQNLKVNDYLTFQ